MTICMPHRVMGSSLLEIICMKTPGWPASVVVYFYVVFGQLGCVQLWGES